MAGNRVFTTGFDNITVGTAVQDIFSILAGASNGVELHYIELNAGGVTNPAEVRLRLKRFSGTTQTAGSAGTAPAMNALDENDSKAATAVVRANDTTQATTTGTNVNLAYWNWNTLLPFQYLPAPEDRPIIAVSNRLILDLPATAAQSQSVSGIIQWREIP